MQVHVIYSIQVHFSILQKRISCFVFIYYYFPILEPFCFKYLFWLHDGMLIFQSEGLWLLWESSPFAMIALPLDLLYLLLLVHCLYYSTFMPLRTNVIHMPRDLSWGPVPINPSEVENIVSWKCIWYIWPPKHHSLGCLTLNVLTLACSWANHLTQSLFYKTVLNISCNLCNYGLLPSCWAIILSSISRVIAFLFFSPEAGDTDGHFLDMMRKHKHSYPESAGITVHCGVWVLHPHHRVADWELGDRCRTASWESTDPHH